MKVILNKILRFSLVLCFAMLLVACNSSTQGVVPDCKECVKFLGLQRRFIMLIW